ncbi:copper amine oxidase N-terminal domain-containing protein [Anaerotignum faecicola]|nr:copper amine oxidase N-terminal domain-containing protein [Anaerotignum faecicola]
MKKNIILKRVLVSTMAVAAIMGTSVFASSINGYKDTAAVTSDDDKYDNDDDRDDDDLDDKYDNDDDRDDNDLDDKYDDDDDKDDSDNDLNDDDDLDDMDDNDGIVNIGADGFVTHEGTVESIEVDKEKGSVTVMISNDNGGLIASIDKNTTILQDGKYKSLDDIEKGMEITFIIPSNAPMGLSMPPFTGSVAVAVLESENSYFTVSKFDNDLLSEEAMLKLNISDDTVITDIKGTKKVYTEDDIKNSELLVFYTVTTRSIPAQTTPSMVMILNKDNGNVETASEPAAEVRTNTVEAKYVSLRELAEEAGYTIDWVSNNEPISIEKDGEKISVEIGSSSIVIDGEAKELSLETKLDGDRVVISTELSDVLK